MAQLIYVVVYWRCRRETRLRICKRFRMPSGYVNINGETPCMVSSDDYELLRECERRGFIRLRDKETKKSLQRCGGFQALSAKCFRGVH